MCGTTWPGPDGYPAEICVNTECVGTYHHFINIEGTPS